MTTTVVIERPAIDIEEPDRDQRQGPADTVPTIATILACGSIDRGDDGAAIAAVRSLAPQPLGVTIREVGQLDIADLLAVPAGSGLIIADTATGLAPGWVVEIPLVGLAGREAGIQPHSSHALSIPETIGLAGVIRGEPVEGMLVAIGGACFGLGEALSWPVAAGLRTFAIAITDAVDRVCRRARGLPLH